MCIIKGCSMSFTEWRQSIISLRCLHGITENYIRARVEGALFLEEAQQIQIPESRIAAHKLYQPHHEKYRVTGIFCPIATKNETIYTNHVIQRTTTRAHQNDSYVS
eukprot:869806_1